MRVVAVVLALVIVLPGCTTSPPSNTSDICAVFREKDDWYEDAADARKEWNSPISVMMAIMHQDRQTTPQENSGFYSRLSPLQRLWLCPGTGVYLGEL
jgi:hypothetical protein